MSRGKELVKNTGILFIAKISTQVVSFLLLPLYTALLSTEEYGQADIYSSLSMIIIPFLTLQIEMALFRFFITAEGKDDKKRVISNSYAIVFILVIFTTVIYYIFTSIISIEYKFLLYFYYLFQAVNVMLLQTCRAFGDNLSYGIASFISSVLAVLLNILFIAGFRLGVEGIILSATLAQLISCLFMLYRTRLFSFFSISCIQLSEIRELLGYSFPLVFNQIASWTVNYSDRLIILWKLGESFNGIYSVACKFSNITNTFFNIFNLAWTESVVRSMKDRDGVEYVNRVLLITFKVYLAGVTGIINIIPFIFTNLINISYNDAYYQVPILLGGALFSGLAAMIGSIFVAYGKTKEVSITTVMAGVCNVGIHFSLIGFVGLYAASISTLVSFLLLFVYRILSVKRFYNIEFKIIQIIPELIIFILSFIAYEIKNPILIVLGLVLNITFVILSFIKYKNEIMNIISSRKPEKN